MGIFVNPGNEAFQVALNSEIYVDKTALIGYTNKVMNTLQAYICNSRPRRFGKSITANMLTAYYSKGCDSSKMFDGLKIADDPGFKLHLNKYDVIHWDIQWCLGNAGEPRGIVSYLTERTVSELREYYSNEIGEEKLSLSETLSKINNVTGHKFIIIIDEWDVLIRDEASNSKAQNEYIAFLRGLFKGTEPTKYIQLAYLTGILPIKKEKTQSALNNFDEYTMLDSGCMADYVGFTAREVKTLADKYGRDFEKLKRWYDGYQLGGVHVYNPKAVVNAVLNGNFKSYWSETASYDAVVPLINMNYDGLKTAIIEMLSGNEVRLNTQTFRNDTVNISSKDDVLTYLIHLGYLAYNSTAGTAFIPNEEIRQEMANAVESVKWNEMLKFWQSSEAVLDATLDMEEDIVAAKIEKIHNDYASSIQYNNENSLSSVLTIAYLSSLNYYFKPIREMPTGRGFADFIFIPKPEYRENYPALVVELKWNKKADTAIQQIHDKHYPEVLDTYTGNILLVGISYDKESKKHSCKIERYKADYWIR